MRRRAVPLVLAFVLGLAAAFAASCTSGGVKGGLPSTSASDLKSQIADVQEFVDRGDCDGIDGQLRQVQQAIDNLPPSTDERLVNNLRSGADQLQSTAISACNARTETQTTETQAVPPETVTEAIPTVTEPPATTTTPADTATTPVPSDTTTTPSATDPTLPDQQPAPGDTNGGAGITP